MIDGATAATFTRTMRLELPTGARSISSRAQRQRLFRLASASSISRLIVLGEQLRATAASSTVSSSGVVGNGLDWPLWSYTSAVQTVNP